MGSKTLNERYFDWNSQALHDNFWGLKLRVGVWMTGSKGVWRKNNTHQWEKTTKTCQLVWFVYTFSSCHAEQQTWCNRCLQRTLKARVIRTIRPTLLTAFICILKKSNIKSNKWLKFQKESPLFRRPFWRYALYSSPMRSLPSHWHSCDFLSLALCLERPKTESLEAFIILWLLLSFWLLQKAPYFMIQIHGSSIYFESVSQVLAWPWKIQNRVSSLMQGNTYA